MENVIEKVSISSLEAELKSFLKTENESKLNMDPKSMFGLVIFKLGTLLERITNYRLLDLEGFVSLEEQEKHFCSELLVQLLLTYSVIDISIFEIFNKIFKLKVNNFSNLDDVEKNIKKIFEKSTLNTIELMDLLFKFNRYVLNLETNYTDFDNAAIAFKTLVRFIRAKEFSFQEILLIGLKERSILID